MRKIYSSLKNKKILILGATGLLGGHLYLRMKELGADVKGTSRFDKKMLYLNTEEPKSINKFHWRGFDVVMDCIGNIDYKKNAVSLEKNIKINLVGPAMILQKLSNQQAYIYCSSYSALLPAGGHNPYSLSKLWFEQYLESRNGEGPKAIVLRVPALFSEN